MNLDIHTHNYKLTDHFTEVLTTKTKKLDKFFVEDTSIKVVCRQIKDTHSLELTILLDNVVCRAEVSSDNMYNNIDIVLPKLEKQIIKHHEKVISKTKKERLKTLQEPLPTHQDNGQLVKTKNFTLVAMTSEDAIARMELIGHDFYVYKDKTTLQTCVAYERKDGDYGVIVVNN